MSFSTWALSQISRLLPIDEDSLNQIIEYSSSLDKDAAAEHLKNLLGDSPQALEFIASFNSRRETPTQASTPSEPSAAPNRPRKKKALLNKLPPPRRPEDYGNTQGAYQKKDEGDYMSATQRAHEDNGTSLANALSLSNKPAAFQLPKIPASSSSTSSRNASPKAPPSAAGSLISDLPNVRTSSRNASPASKTKIALTGGTPMHGASTTLTDLDSAIRALEVQTNPSLTSTDTQGTAARRCDCLATRHPLLAAAPNCLNCGKIICVKEGIGPCTFCNHALLSPSDLQAMVRTLKEERGREKMEANNSSQRRADVAKTPKAFQPPLPNHNDANTSNDPSLANALKHKANLLNYQAQNARRTHIIDEAADFETPAAGQSMWSSPVERAAQLKRQQKVLREQEWNARPEYEKRRVVVSVDLVGGKVVRRMGAVERPEEKEEAEETVTGESSGRGEGAGGAFGRNPLLGGMIKPVWKEKGRDGADTAADGQDKENQRREMTWRRVQDDNDDNEGLILDGGVYGGRESERRLGEEEHAFG